MKSKKIEHPVASPNNRIQYIHQDCGTHLHTHTHTLCTHHTHRTSFTHTCTHAHTPHVHTHARTHTHAHTHIVHEICAHTALALANKHARSTEELGKGRTFRDVWADEDGHVSVVKGQATLVAQDQQAAGNIRRPASLCIGLHPRQSKKNKMRTLQVALGLDALAPWQGPLCTF